MNYFYGVITFKLANAFEEFSWRSGTNAPKFQIKAVSIEKYLSALEPDEQRHIGLGSQIHSCISLADHLGVDFIIYPP